MIKKLSLYNSRNNRAEQYYQIRGLTDNNGKPGFTLSAFNAVTVSVNDVMKLSI